MSNLLTIFNVVNNADPIEYGIADYYKALYWYASLNHEGQFSVLYYILSTLKYRPAMSEQAEDVDFDGLGFPISHDNMVTLATALRLWSTVQHTEYDFVGLHYFETKNVYLAEYRNYWNEDAEYDTRYATFYISEDGTIEDQTIIE